MTDSNQGESINDSAWAAFRDRFEVGQLVEGVVVEHRPFGMFVDIGSPQFLALVELPSMESAPGSRSGTKGVAWSAVGSRVKSVFLGFSTPNNRQPRLLMRRTALQAAEAVQRVANLPIEGRMAFLQQALNNLEPDIPSAAVWRVRYLPANERAEFLRHALVHPDDSVAAQAVRRVVDLPARERATFLRQAMQHRNPKVARLAVWQAGHLPMQDRAAFLQEASQRPIPEVAERARFELAHLPHDSQSDGGMGSQTVD